MYVVVADSDASVLMDAIDAVGPAATIGIVHVPCVVFRQQMTWAGASSSSAVVVESG